MKRYVGGFLGCLLSICVASCGAVQVIVGPTKNDYAWFRKLGERVNSRKDMARFLEMGRDPLHVTGDKLYVYCVISSPSKGPDEALLKARYGAERYMPEEIPKLVGLIQDEMEIIGFPYPLHVKVLERTDWVARIASNGQNVEWFLDRPADPQLSFKRIADVGVDVSPQ